MRKVLLFFAMWAIMFMAKAQSTIILSPGDGVVLSVKSSQITIAWNDNSDNESGFNIYRSESSNLSKNSKLVGSVSANETRFIDKTVQPQSTYYYSVTAFNDQNESNLLEPSLMATTLAGKKIDNSLIPPSEIYVTNVKATQATLQWQSNANNIDGYRVYKATEPLLLFSKKSLVSEVLNKTSFIDTALQKGTKYYYSVSSFNKTGESSISNNIVVAQTLSNKKQVPNKPTNLILSNIKTDQITINWTDKSDNEDGFYIYRSESNFAKDSILVGFTSPNNTAFVDRGLSAEKYYYYTVIAYNSGGFANSDIQVGKTVKYNSKEIATIPVAPKDLYFSSLETNQVTLNWADISFNEEGFYIFRSSTPQFSDAKLIANLVANTQSFTDASLNDNTTYYYVIASYNIAGNSFLNNGNLMAITTSSSVVPITPPPPTTCEDFANHGIARIHLYANTRENLLVGTFYAYNQPQYNCYGQWKDALFLGNEMGSNRKLWGYREPYNGYANVKIRTKSSCTEYPDVRNTYPYTYLGAEKKSIPNLSNNINHTNLNLLFYLSTDISTNAAEHNIYRFAIKNHIPNLLYRINGGNWQSDVLYVTDANVFSNIGINYTNIPFFHPPKDFIIDFSVDGGNSIDRYIVRRNTTGGHFGITTTLTRVENNEVKVCMYQGDQYTRTFLIDSNGNRHYSDNIFGNSFSLGSLSEGEYFYKLGFADTDVIFDDNILVQVK